MVRNITAQMVNVMWFVIRTRKLRYFQYLFKNINHIMIWKSEPNTLGFISIVASNLCIFILWRRQSVGVWVVQCGKVLNLWQEYYCTSAANLKQYYYNIPFLLNIKTNIIFQQSLTFQVCRWNIFQKRDKLYSPLFCCNCVPIQNRL